MNQEELQPATAPEIVTPRQKRIVGNWKMYKTAKETIEFLKALLPLVQEASAKIYLAVPFTSIKSAADYVHIKNDPFLVGAQNMHDASEGAFTGEICASMLKEAGAKFVVLGHSERRTLFHEDNEFINRKIIKALQEKLQPILCIGETLKQREHGETASHLKKQIKEGLSTLSSPQVEQVILAYEPIWAIGTHHSATPQIAEETHRICRNIIREEWGDAVAEKVAILYGGSVKPENAKGLLEQRDIDGLLVGGASLSAENFSKIVNASNLSQGIKV